MISMFGLAAGLALLIFLTIRGLHILIAAPLAALLVAMSAGLPLVPPLAAPGETDFVTAYMNGFTGFFAAWFFMFLFGAIFGEVMAATGAADSAAHWIVERFGVKHAMLAVVIACALLTYGGVSVFIVAFSVYPMAASLFKRANLPRRFIPGALAFGSVTFTMTSAGSPEIQNIIPIEHLGTTAYAGWGVSLVVAAFMAAFGYAWLARMIRRAVARGETFNDREGDDFERDFTTLPHPLLSLAPLAVVLAVFFIYQYPERMPAALRLLLPDQSLGKYALVAALGAGAVAAALIGIKSVQRLPLALTAGATGAVVAITNTCAVVGFGTVARATPAFQTALDAVVGLPGDPLIGAAVAVTVIAGLTGSASGGQSIALPLLAPHYLEAGVNPSELHRVVAIASGALDSLPHNGYVVTTIRAICGETHKDAYGAVGALTVIVPLIGLAMAIAAFVVF